MTPSTRATNPVTDGLLLKGGNAFLVTDPEGWIPPDSACGLYLNDTRHLSGYTWDLGADPLHLHRIESPELFAARLEYISEDHPNLSVTRHVALASHLLETVQVSGRGAGDPLRLSLAADYQDVFEVRGLVDAQPREPASEVAPRALTFTYDGRDGVRRWTRISFYPPPDETDRQGALWRPDSPSSEPIVTTKVEIGTGEIPRLGGLVLAADLAASLRKDWESRARKWRPFRTEDDGLGAWLQRAAGDAASLPIRVNRWSVPAAGLPWYATAFGRDSLIFGLQTVYLRPEVSMEILRFLAAHQGSTRDAHRAEEPGKILHELRRGELAGAGRLPHTPYYGAVDTTSLFLCLLAEVYRWTGDVTFVRELYPAAKRAFAHIQATIAGSPEGFLGYVGDEPPGLRHQGWKDGEWGILRPDGSQPDPPVAPCEVQGYAYWGLQGLSEVARTLEEEAVAGDADEAAAQLRTRFDKAFWMPQETTYAVALEGSGEPMGSVTSNPGQLLMSGILSEARTEALAARMLQEDLFSGWGIRTLSDQSSPYDPLSYHNGSVWPHDTALIAWGLARSGFPAQALRLFEGLRDAAGRFSLSRLPELFSGHPREGNQDPVRVHEAGPVQAWVTGVPFLFLRTLLGMEVEAPAKVLRLTPSLPANLGRLEVRDLRVGTSRLSLRVRGEGPDAQVTIQRQEGPRIEVLTP